MTRAIVFVGATGELGQQLAQGLVTAEGFEEKVALVRSIGDKSKKLENLGWTVRLVDFEDATGLRKAMANAMVVVSCLAGGSLVDTEKRVMDAAKSSGVSLFVPSQFGVDVRRWSATFPHYARKQAVLDYSVEIGMPTLKVFNGFFADTIFFFLADPVNMRATLVNGGDYDVSFTKRSDIGYVLAKALADPEYSSGGFLSMAGQTMTWREALGIIEELLGKKFEFTEMTADHALQKEQDGLNEGNVRIAFKLHLLGELGRGRTGVNTSAEAKHYGCNLSKLRDILQTVLATPA